MIPYCYHITKNHWVEMKVFNTISTFFIMRRSFRLPLKTIWAKLTPFNLVELILLFKHIKRLYFREDVVFNLLLKKIRTLSLCILWLGQVLAYIKLFITSIFLCQSILIISFNENRLFLLCKWLFYLYFCCQCLCLSDVC